MKKMLRNVILIFLLGVTGIIYQIVNENVEQSIQRLFIMVIILALWKEFITFIIYNIKNKKNNSKKNILLYISFLLIYIVCILFSLFFFGYIIIVISLFS